MPPIADMSEPCRHFRDVPGRDIPASKIADHDTFTSD
jgi:hypothetical protein